jgi:hypothetical protein
MKNNKLFSDFFQSGVAAISEVNVLKISVLHKMQQNCKRQIAANGHSFITL